jgi:hypothetical protein
MVNIYTIKSPFGGFIPVFICKNRKYFFDCETYIIF